jgi:hypothetical protein
MAAAEMLTRDDLRLLAGTAGGRRGPHVSIYLPTLRADVTQQNQVRFKDLLRRSEEGLAAWGLKRAASAELLEPLRELLEDAAFWHAPRDGMAVFRSEDLFRASAVAVPFNELAVVETRFHLKPLFRLFGEGGSFFILAVSQKRVRLLRADRWGAEELAVDFGDLPASFEDNLAQTTRQYQMGSRVRAPAQPPVVHGHGAGVDELKPELLDYFHHVAHRLVVLRREREAPVVLAGVEYLQALFRQAGSQFNLLPEGLNGNYDHAGPRELWQAAWKVAEPVLDARRRAAMERYQELAAKGRASCRLEEVVPAAHDGRIETLFAASGVRRWGTYDPVPREVRVRTNGSDGAAPAPGEEDLVDLAAVQTFLHGGEVYVGDPGAVPGGGETAAIFRY